MVVSTVQFKVKRRKKLECEKDRTRTSNNTEEGERGQVSRPPLPMTKLVKATISSSSGV